jgi:hypothetical protein
MRHKASIVTVALITSLMFVIGGPTRAQVVWQLDNTSNIGGNAVTLVRSDPTVVSTPFGNGLAFDGDDGIIVDANPIFGAATFTIEMIFRPDSIVNASSNQPRVLHVQSTIPPDHRATLETRVVGQQWYLDAFLRSQRPGQANASIVNSLTLIDPNNLHPLGLWYNFAMTYDGAQLRAYVNGQLELSGDLAVLATADGQVSLGMRHNQVNFFEGVIAKVRFTPSVVDPTNFLSVAIPGDYDGNLIVDDADYVEWMNAFGQSVANPGDGADGNRDGMVDAADYTVWRDHLTTAGAASLSQNVPEPATAILFAAGILAATLRPHRPAAGETARLWQRSQR